MGRIVYFTGGARSGKSVHSEQYILDRHYDHKIYLATAVVFDEEMKERVKLHMERRGKEWDTLEGYRNLYDLVKSSMKETTRGVILLDCITNMVSNLLLEEQEDWDNISQERIQELEKYILEEISTFLEKIKKTSYDLVVVSNELGMGLVPPYPLGRYFRDICGRANQLVAEEAQESYFIVSGTKLRLK
ncbi:MAG TPA: bifunctional adenosylcobinamide kinase/adenosylcobinamide-phosphate guanylyltransferase [Fusobacterium sp.]|uniref:bifunctional adenosylcobinamide kinase/adenosylcobinamide-phosphate guanylyltransferase n=1 Tax=Fusobacterium sp. TaxID=68766 RepID=UPI002F42B9BE